MQRPLLIRQLIQPLLPIKLLMRHRIQIRLLIQLHPHQVFNGKSQVQFKMVMYLKALATMAMWFIIVQDR